MIYQDDFEEKHVLDDGSTNFPDFLIRDYGCYFMCLCYLRGLSSFEEIRDLYFQALLKRAIDYDCFVRDPLFFLPESQSFHKIPCGEEFSKFRSSHKIQKLICRWYLEDPILKEKGQRSHFIVLDPETLSPEYDPISKGSRHVFLGKPIGLRVFV